MDEKLKPEIEEKVMDAVFELQKIEGILKEVFDAVKKQRQRIYEEFKRVYEEGYDKGYSDARSVFSSDPVCPEL